MTPSALRARTPATSRRPSAASRASARPRSASSPARRSSTTGSAARTPPRSASGCRGSPTSASCSPSPATPATYSVDLINADGTGAQNIIEPTTLAGAPDWLGVPKVALDDSAMKIGKAYRIRITTRYDTGATVVPGGAAAYDAVQIRARRATGKGNGHGGGADTDAGLAKSGIAGNAEISNNGKRAPRQGPLLGEARGRLQDDPHRARHQARSEADPASPCDASAPATSASSR